MSTNTSTPAANDVDRQRERMAEAARITGSQWLTYMSTNAEPSLTEDAWSEAVAWTDKVLRQYA